MNDSPASGAGEASLDGLVKRGLTWSLVNTASTRTATFLVGVVLARLLAPQDYGVYAVALVASQLLLSLNDIGVSSAIVRWPGDIKEIAATGATVVFGASVALFAALFVAAGPIAKLLNVPESAAILRLMSFGVVLDAVFAIPAAGITRSFQQRTRTFADMTNLVVWAVLSISLAALGYGAWGLAWGRLAGTVAGGIVILCSSPLRVKPGFDRAIARDLLRFGVPLVGAELLTFAVLNTDYIVVGHVLGSVALGYYYLAFNLSSWPVNTISFTVRRVSLAGFSRLQHDAAEMRRAFVSAARLLTAVAGSVCALLAALASPLVLFVYGAKWAPAIQPLRWLAILGAVRVLAELGYDFLVGAGRPRRTALLQLAWFMALVPALVVGAHLGGIGGVGAAHVLVAVAVVIPVMLIALQYRLGVRASAVLGAIFPSVVLAILTAVVAALASGLVQEPFAKLLVGGAAGLTLPATVALIAWRNRTRAATRAEASTSSRTPSVGGLPDGAEATIP